MGLRQLGKVVSLRPPQRQRAIAITGGKGGVGKSAIAVNLAVAYAQQSSRTVIVDADMGMADLNLLLGVAPDKTLHDVARGMDVEDVLVEAHGVHLVPTLNGNDALERMGDDERRSLLESIELLDEQFDTLVIDVGAGVGANQTVFAGAVPTTVVVVTPEPLSLADAYATLKVLSQRQGLQRAYVLPNRVRNANEAQEVVDRLSALVARFLDISLSALPAIPFDPAVEKSSFNGQPLIISHPDCSASRAIRRVARRLDALSMPDHRTGITRLFWRGTFENEAGGAS